MVIRRITIGSNRLLAAGTGLAASRWSPLSGLGEARSSPLQPFYFAEGLPAVLAAHPSVTDE